MNLTPSDYDMKLLTQRRQRLLEEIDELSGEDEYDEVSEEEKEEKEEKEGKEEEEEEEEEKEEKEAREVKFSSLINVEGEEETDEGVSSDEEVDIITMKIEREPRKEKPINISRSQLKEVDDIKNARKIKKETIKSVNNLLIDFKTKMNVKLRWFKKLDKLDRATDEDVDLIIAFHNNMRNEIEETIEYYIDQMPEGYDLDNSQYDKIENALSAIYSAVEKIIE